MSLYSKKIPSVEFIHDWKYIHIKENNEKLISLKNIHPKIKIKPQYYSNKIPYAINDCLCREGLVEKLIQAANSLPKDLMFLVYDAWRPIKVQQFFFNFYKEKLKAKNPTIEDDVLEIEAQKYVSKPSSNPKCPSPHYTGGSIDLTLIGKNNLVLNMGTKFDHFGVESKTNFYETHLSNDTQIIRNHRRILYNVMVSNGFTNYPEEWWHFDYGNQFWGYLSNNNALYGAIDYTF